MAHLARIRSPSKRCERILQDFASQPRPEKTSIETKEFGR